jgi:hypothetical protein
MKYFALIGLIAIALLLSGCVNQDSYPPPPDNPESCEQADGTWIEKGSPEECDDLNEEDCAKNPNCTSYSVPMGEMLPALEFDHCGPTNYCEIRSCIGPDCQWPPNQPK